MGFCPSHMLFSFQHAASSCTAVGIPRGVFKVLLLSAHQPCTTRVLIFPIFMGAPEYLKLLGTIGLPNYWFTDHCSIWVSKSSPAGRGTFKFQRSGSRYMHPHPWLKKLPLLLGLLIVYQLKVMFPQIKPVTSTPAK